jgi:hypothetical protein
LDRGVKRSVTRFGRIGGSRSRPEVFTDGG